LVHAKHEIGGRGITDVEVLVQPKPRAGAGQIEAALLPIALDASLLVALHEDESLALDDKEVCAGIVPVGLLVGADLEAGDVRVDHAAGQHEEGVGAATAALLPLPELHLADVGDEVSLPEAATVELALAAEVITLTGVAVGEREWIIEDEILVQPLPHQPRQIGHREIARRL